MKTYSLSHLSDGCLLHDLATLVARDRATTAELLAHIAEVDARKLYLPAGYPSMYAYCVEELGLSEDSAYKRIQAARTARQFPGVFGAVADGCLNLSGVCLLAPHLTRENANDLLHEASGKKKSEIEALIAKRFPRSELLPIVEALPVRELAPGQVGCSRSERAQVLNEEPAPGQVAAPAPRSTMGPIAADRFALQVTIGKETHDKLRHAQALLSHRVPDGDLAEVLSRVLDLAIGQLEKQKFAATDRPRPDRGSNDPRTIPAHVQRAVWHRDAGQCAFVGERGHRCEARERLEFDHVEPVARGGQATVNGIRLRCRPHNQYEAERIFGAEFMSYKRLEARRCAEARQAAVCRAAKRERIDEVAQCLRQLRYHADEARRAAEYSDSIPRASLEDRVKRALNYFAPRVTSAARTC